MLVLEWYRYSVRSGYNWWVPKSTSVPKSYLPSVMDYRKHQCKTQKTKLKSSEYGRREERYKRRSWTKSKWSIRKHSSALLTHSEHSVGAKCWKIWRYNAGQFHCHNACVKWNLLNWCKLQIALYCIRRFFIYYNSHKLHYVDNSSSETWTSDDSFMCTTELINADLVSLVTAPLKRFSLIERIRNAPPAVIPLYLDKHKERQNVCELSRVNIRNVPWLQHHRTTFKSIKWLLGPTWYGTKKAKCQLGIMDVQYLCIDDSGSTDAGEGWYLNYVDLFWNDGNISLTIILIVSCQSQQGEFISMPIHLLCDLQRWTATQ